MAEIPLNMLPFVEKCEGKDVVIIIGEPGPEGQKAYAGKFVEKEGDKAIIVEKGTGKRIVIDMNSITNYGLE